MDKISGFYFNMSAIKPVQANMMFKVDPVAFYTSRNYSQNSQDFMNQGLFKDFSSNYNLNHPKISGSETQAKFLDLTA